MKNRIVLFLLLAGITFTSFSSPQPGLGFAITSDGVKELLLPTATAAIKQTYGSCLGLIAAWYGLSTIYHWYTAPAEEAQYSKLFGGVALTAGGIYYMEKYPLIPYSLLSLASTADKADSRVD